MGYLLLIPVTTILASLILVTASVYLDATKRDGVDETIWAILVPVLLGIPALVYFFYSRKAGQRTESPGRNEKIIQVLYVATIVGMLAALASPPDPFKTSRWVLIGLFIGIVVGYVLIRNDIWPGEISNS